MQTGRRLSVCVGTLLALLASANTPAQGQTVDEPSSGANTWYTLHFQQTTVTQAHPAFRSEYDGAGSLRRVAETETTITSTLFAGLSLWKGAELYLNPELSGGSGLSTAFGVAGFPNGEAFRVGSAKPVLYPARLFLRQTINFRGGEERVDKGPNAIAGSRSSHRLTVTIGKFGIADIFDNNKYTHDPRTQFFNWALMNSGAWDYPADTRGYTWGLSLEYTRESWTIRGASVLVPREANGLAMDTHVAKSHGFALENELRYDALGRPGTIRLLVFLNSARMGDYDEAVAANPTAPVVSDTREYGRTKYGFAIGVEQELADGLGAFTRLSWNDGKHETWAFAEIDQSLAIGAVLNGARWTRSLDEVSVALVLNGISGPHRRYLAAGGYGFMLGDSRLDYGLESIAEAYYKLHIIEHLTASVDYQLVVNPAYNRDRGPVNIFGVRSHVEF
jgi:high affinity Mn2+ porin